MSSFTKRVISKSRSIHCGRLHAILKKEACASFTYRQYMTLRSRTSRQTHLLTRNTCLSTGNVTDMLKIQTYQLPSATLCSNSGSPDIHVVENYVSNCDAEGEKEGDLALYQNPSISNMFVPKCEPVKTEDIKRLQEFVHHSRRLLVFTGAGISTESGIPDYRSEGVGLYARSTNRPIQYADFVRNPEMRKRYWARNYVGWPKFGYFLPNSSHVALAEWEKRGKVLWLVTQNVDALHYKAGSKKVTELHGSAHRVMCLDCDHKMSRQEMQKLIKTYNPEWSAHSEEMAPDADVQLTPEQIQGFTVPPCPNCGGSLKPEITFFGDNVAKAVVEFVHEKVRECDRLLMAGTSLQVYSGYRFVAAAKEQGKPIAILNIGPTRADKLAQLHIHAKCGDVLPKTKCGDNRTEINRL